MAVALEKIVDEIRALSPEQQRRVREILDNAGTPKDGFRRRKDEISQQLREKGISVKVPSPMIDTRAFDEWKPIKIEGKPLSETIIEERR